MGFETVSSEKAPNEIFETIQEAERFIEGLKLEAERATESAAETGPEIDLTGKISGGAEHTKGASSSKEGKHQRGQARKHRDYGGEKGDKRRGWPRKPPNDMPSGPWPPK